MSDAENRDFWEDAAGVIGVVMAVQTPWMDFVMADAIPYLGVMLVESDVIESYSYDLWMG